MVWMQSGNNKSGDPHQLHLGTRVHYYRCSLPGLAGFVVYRRERTDADHHRVQKVLPS